MTVRGTIYRALTADHRLSSAHPLRPSAQVSKKEAPATCAGAIPPFILQAVTYFFFSYGYFLTRSSPSVELGNPVNVKV
jgi:hypothetical protein